MSEPNDVSGGARTSAPAGAAGHGLSLAPFRAVRYTAAGNQLAELLCPPYDVIDEGLRARLLDAAPDNAVQLILPNLGGDPAQKSPYERAASTLTDWVSNGIMAVDDVAAVYVYEMAPTDGSVTRGLLGAIELHDYRDQVILPHENTMAGPVADRLALMEATDANLEPIYLVYDGGGAASTAVASVDGRALVDTTTADGTRHRLWAITDPPTLAAIEDDLRDRRALIADGHHRYATYLELQRLRCDEYGAGPWDRGLTLLVDSSSYGPQVHAIHRVLAGMSLDRALEQGRQHGCVESATNTAAALTTIGGIDGFAVVLTDGQSVHVLRIDDPAVLRDLLEVGEPAPMADLDVTVLHRGVLPRVWAVADTEANVRYAHDTAEAIAVAQATAGTAVLLRPTPVAAVAAVAAAGARMPRKSTLFTPKPASGLVIRRFVDQRADD
jgi:uncharacterized protein (DUF1015 family)